MSDGNAALALRPWVSYQLALQETLLTRSLPADPAASATARIAITHRLEQVLHRLVAMIKPRLVVEIGAHAAEFSVAAREALPEARIVAFEANREIFAHHAARLRGLGIETHNLAVANENGARRFGVPLHDGRAALTMGSLRADRHATDTSWTEIDCVRADSFFADAAAPANILWIDVEGAALEVLEGCEGLLAATLLIYVEVESRPRWEDQGTADEIFAFLEPFGFIPLLRDVFRRGWQYNCLLGRPALLQSPAVRRLFDDYLFTPAPG